MPKENYMFLGSPGTGKSELMNCLIGRRVFNSIGSYNSTVFFHKFTHNDIVYMDSTGLADFRTMHLASEAITKEIRSLVRCKLFFFVRLQNGRVVADDMAAAERVLDSIGIQDVPYSIIVNNVGKRQYRVLMEHGKEYENLVRLLNSIGHKTTHVVLVPTIDELDEWDGTGTVASRLPSDVEHFIKHEAAVADLRTARVCDINLDEYDDLVEETHDQLEYLRVNRARP